MTTTGTEPHPECGGVTTLICCGESTVTLAGASGVPENDTVVPPILKSAPLIVTVVPPRIDPMDGASDVIVGAATVSRAMDVPQSQELVEDAVSSAATQTSLG